MAPRLHSVRPAGPAPKRGVSAHVLIDGFAPGAPKSVFEIEREFTLLANYLLEGDRGFSRVVPIPQFPKPAFISLSSEPQDINQFRIAFGLTLLGDARELDGRMGVRLLFADRAVSRFVYAGEVNPCIKFLEIMEGVDDLLVKFRYRDQKSNVLVYGNVSF